MKKHKLCTQESAELLLYMRPMPLFESLESTGSVSLSELFSGVYPMGVVSKLNLADYSFLICRGGWPQSVGLPREKALKIAKKLLCPSNWKWLAWRYRYS